MWVEERPGFYRIEVPLPGNPLKALNAYLVKGAERSLLIDNGFNIPESFHSLRESLAEIGVPPESLDFFITHLHADHNGLTHRFAGREARIYCGQTDGEITNAAISDPDIWRDALFILASHGFPPDLLHELYETHPGRIYANPERLPFTWITENQVLDYGSYRLRAILVPGHTPGHFALFEDQASFLVAGDHVLGTITPNITCWQGVEDSLGDYLDSLEKIAALAPEVTFPGHRAVVADTRMRILELQAHHKSRLDEALAIVRAKGKANAWTVASEMKWSLRGAWADYRVAQKNFATGEAVAHLDHLVKLGKLDRINNGGQIFYSA